MAGRILHSTTKTKDITGGLPRGVHINVHEGEHARAQQLLPDGLRAVFVGHL